MDSNLMILLAIGLTGLAVFLFFWGAYPTALLAEATAEGDGKNVVGTARNILIRKAGMAQGKFLSASYREKMKWKFIAMGKPETRAEDFLVYQEIAAVFFTLFMLLLLNALKKPLYWSVFGGIFGFIYPFMWLREQIKKRQKKIVRALPYALDLLTLSVEAGLDFQAAIQTVVDKAKAGPLSEEFSLMLSEIRMGRTREESLRNMAKRIQVSAISSFVTNLIQADRMGTSLGKILRIQSTQMRIDRTQLAEKKANEAPVKMLFPLVACIFPTVFMVLFAPIVYAFMSGGGGI
ncbi:type II secretion system F family protein [Myxococcota bacterium]|nr:type II secretion system F family protein [Myxococcota bacterium]MBU1412427.1 type II secretion system F family protein [Myxococcota bacterium]MBU1511837.1 type II secretion system F family protein [Myxococcota bacterium]